MSDEPDLNQYWDDRKRRSLRRAPDRQAAENLLSEIYRWSGRQMRWGANAGEWVTDMEPVLAQTTRSATPRGESGRLVALV
jgi:hypothetical protein